MGRILVALRLLPTHHARNLVILDIKLTKATQVNSLPWLLHHPECFARYSNGYPKTQDAPSPKPIIPSRLGYGNALHRDCRSSPLATDHTERCNQFNILLKIWNSKKVHIKYKQITSDKNLTSTTHTPAIKSKILKIQFQLENLF